MSDPRANPSAHASSEAATETGAPSALEVQIADLIGQCADVRVTYDSVQRRYTHVANADDLAAAIMRMVAKTEGRP